MIDRLKQGAKDREDKLDEALEDSMDASDPPATSRPEDDGGPVPSSGFPAKGKRA